ncbi:MAG: PBECR2 nuclease fold domain-containing protein [Bdellovibrionota bacterium]
MAKAKSRAKTKKNQKSQELILIDEGQGLIFESEKDLYGYFSKSIIVLENEYNEIKSQDDFSDEEQIELEKQLEITLDEPDEVWRDEERFDDIIVHYFIRNFLDENEKFTYVAVAYVSAEEQIPTFVLFHFPTKNMEMIKTYQKGTMVYNQTLEAVEEGAVEGDALVDGDPLAIGLYLSTLKLRSEKDIPQARFKEFQDLREDTIENADEIWRKNDMDGNILVSFIKEFPDHEVKGLYYVAVTQEDSNSNVHALLFSFPTNDESLVDRYRQGENLQAEEISQESSH